MIERTIKVCPHTKVKIQTDDEDEMFFVADHLMATAKRNNTGGVHLSMPTGFGMEHNGTYFDLPTIRKPIGTEVIIKENRIFASYPKN